MPTTNSPASRYLQQWIHLIHQGAADTKSKGNLQSLNQKKKPTDGDVAR